MLRFLMALVAALAFVRAAYALPIGQITIPVGPAVHKICTVATLNASTCAPQPTSSAFLTSIALVTDGSSGTDCSTGAGATLNWCYWDRTAQDWLDFAPGGAGGGGTPAGGLGDIQYSDGVAFDAENAFDYDEVTNLLSVGAIQNNATDPADSGTLRIGNTNTICSEASPAGTDVCLSVDASEIWQVTGGTFDGGDLTAASVAGAALADDAVGLDELDLIDGDTPISGDCALARPAGTGGTIEFATCPGGGGDNLFIDGTDVTTADLRSDHNVDLTRCTGAGAPDAACPAADDVLFRFDPTELASITTWLDNVPGSATWTFDLNGAIDTSLIIRTTGDLDLSGTTPSLNFLDANANLNIAGAFANATVTTPGSETSDLTLYGFEAGSQRNVLAMVGATGITLGDAAANSITLTTDGTGDAEIVLPADSIGAGEITDNSLTASDLAATLTFADADLISMASVSVTGSAEGLLLPQHATSCSSATAEGQVCWEADANLFWVGDGVAPVQVGPGAGDVTAVGDCTTGDCFTGPAGTRLSSNTDIFLRVDEDNNGTESLQIENGADIVVAEVDESGNLQIDGALTSDATGTSDFDGALSAPSFTADDAVVEPGNRILLNDNDIAFTLDPTCANSGGAGQLGLVDSDETAADQWDVCDGTTLRFRFPATSTTATHFLSASATAGVVVFEAIATGDLPSGATLDTEWDTVGEIETATGSVNILLETEIDASSELLALMDDETGTGALCFATSPTIATPVLTGKIDRNNVSVDDDDCTGEQGIAWYDTTDSAFEFCNASSGAPAVLGGGGGAPAGGAGDIQYSDGAAFDAEPAFDYDETTNTLTVDNLTSIDSVVSGSTPAASGIYRLSNGQTICWRNNIDSLDICFNVGLSNFLTGTAGTLSGALLTNGSVDDSALAAGAVDGGSAGEVSDGTIDGEDLNANVAGAGLQEVAGSPDALATASGETDFLVDGGVTSLTCGGTNVGRMQVMDDGQLQFCDGAATSVLRSGFFDADGIDDDIPEDDDLDVITNLMTLGLSFDTTNNLLKLDHTLTLVGNPALAAENCAFTADGAGGGVLCEGPAADTAEGLLLFDVQTADKTWTLPNESGTICTTGSVCAGYSASSHSHTLAGDVDGDVGSTDLDEAAVETELESVLDLAGLQERDIDSLTGQSDIDTEFVFDGVEVDFDGGTTNAWPRLLNETTPTATDCDVAGEAGRLAFDPDLDTDGSVVVCRGTSGWKDVDDDGGAGGFSSFNADGDNNSPQTITDGNELLIAGGAGIATTAAATDTVTVATASGETGFLASGALTCTTAQQGRMQVHTTALQYCDNSGTPTLRYAAYGDSAGVASSAAAMSGSGQIDDNDLAAAAVDGGNAGEIADSSITIDDLAGQSSATLLRSAYWSAGAMSPDLTQCTAAAAKTLGAAGAPIELAITCADNDAGSLYGSVNMPDSFNGGTVVFWIEAFCDEATCAGTLEFDCSCMFRGNGEAVGTTWGSEPTGGSTVAFASDPQYAQDDDPTDATTCNGTWASGESLYWRCQVDATATDVTPTTNYFVLGVKMEFATNALTD